IEGTRFALSESTPLSWDGFSRFTATLMGLRGPDLPLVRGMLNVKGCEGPVAVEYLQHLAARPVELQAWPDQNRVTRIEFTTRGIDERMVRSLFDSIRALA